MTTSLPPTTSTITYANPSSNSVLPIGSITLNSAGTGYSIVNGIGQTVTISSISTGSNGTVGAGSGWWKDPVEFVDSFPAWSRIQAMCKEYPGLEIAFRNFKNTYNLVKDDYDNPNTKK